jgi:hypothetical protein
VSIDDKLLREAQETRDELKDLTREAHAALKDLRKAMEEAPKIVGLLTARKIEEQVKGEVEEGLEQYKDQISKAIDEATQTVYDRFDKIAGILIGRGSFSLEALTAAYVAAGADSPKDKESGIQKLTDIMTGSKS